MGSIRLTAASAALLISSGLLAGCSDGSSSGDTLTWYINPDAGGQAKVAENCSTDDYTIKVQVLPQSATEQRIQLSRRLAANDSAIDLMSIDPIFTAEFANAGYLAAFTDELKAGWRSSPWRAPSTRPPGRTSSSSPRCGSTPSSSGIASRWPRRPGSTCRSR